MLDRQMALLRRSSRTGGQGRTCRVSALVAPGFTALLTLAVCLAWLPHFTERLNPLTGDEPFYVMTAISLVEDGDLDETNNYANRDYARFYPALGPTAEGWSAYPDPLPPHQSHTRRAGLYSKHGLGLTLLIALPFTLGGRTLVLIVLAALSALLAANMTLLARRYTASNVLAVAVALGMALTNPLLPFSLLIFPELPAALCTIYALRRVLAPRNAWWQWGLAGSAAAFLPWLHYRLIPVSITLAVLAFIRHRHAVTPRQVIAAVAPPLISAVTLSWWFVRLYGRPLPPAADHAGFSGIAGTLNGLAGTFLDQQWGAWVHNPLLFLAIATMLPFAIHQRDDAIAIGAVAVPYLLVVASYRVWWGEWNPPARYLTVLVPLAVAPLAWWLSQVSLRWRWLCLVGVLIPSLLVSATFVWDPQVMYNHPDGTSRLLEVWSQWSHQPLTSLIPSFVFYSASAPAERLTFSLAAVAWLCLLSTAAWLAIGQGARRRTLAGGAEASQTAQAVSQEARGDGDRRHHPFSWSWSAILRRLAT
jgi:hypothetical protein